MRALETENSPEEEPRHKCGLVAFSYQHPDSGLRVPLYSASKIQHRGQEGEGFVAIDKSGEVYSYRTRQLIRDVDSEPAFQEYESSLQDKDIQTFMVHNRYSTSGRLDASQPFIDFGIVTAHNGNLTNPRDLFSYIPREYHNAVSSDTHALHMATVFAEGKNLEEKVQHVLPNVEGAYSLIMADASENALYGIRDPWGFRPLQIGKLKNGNGYMLASETVAFYQIADKVRSVRPGEGVKIQGDTVETFFEDPRSVQRASCIFEPVYFSFPTSEVFGIKSGKLRHELGAQLALEDLNEGFIPDMIIPVLDSGLKGAEGYSQTMIRELLKNGKINAETVSHLMTKHALLKDKYNSGRTFILPGDRVRMIDNKYILDEDEVQGKCVVLVDDSIVRGNSMRRIIQRLRDAGVSEVHARIYFPPIRHACHMGIDFANERELEAFDRTEDEVRDDLGADSLRYIDRDQMIETAKRLSIENDIEFCDACVTGNYPVTIKKESIFFKRGS